ncbi:MAG TPA: methyltransferase domain-containing protein [Candidatus Hydrogenedentes bacterium]|nr:methyltransferase domain-containing protein [Candidatus Hydrogenedentota bacterium]
MNASSPKPSPDKPSLAIPEDMAARLGARRYRLLMQWIRDVNGAYDAALAEYVTNESILLDAGSSRGDPDLPSLARARQAVACDVDLAGLRANVLVRDRVVSPLETLPFRSGAFDVIVCKFVLEHVSAPLRVLREFARVLRPGGIIAVLTPNRLSVFAAVSSLVPYSAKQWLKKVLFGGHSEDTFRTYYRANTPGTLDRLMGEAGFVNERIEMLAGMWAFFIFSTPLALAVRAVERLQTRIPIARNCSTHIMGVWRKPLAVATG